jgi:hypothetical protein
MSGVTGFMVLNPVLQATPLNFRGWLRNSLDIYIKEQGQPGVVALAFFTPHYINAIGRKKLEKILSDATQKHKSWLRAINMMTTPKALSDDEAEKIVEEMLAESAKAREEDLAGAHLGYSKSPEDDPDGLPVCMIRKAQEKDLVVLRKANVQYKVGDWYVMGEIDGRQSLSQPLPSLEEAQGYGSDFFGAHYFEKSA